MVLYCVNSEIVTDNGPIIALKREITTPIYQPQESTVWWNINMFSGKKSVAERKMKTVLLKK